MNGFYSIYFTGTAGSGFGLIALSAGTIVGVDVTGGLFDGNYEMSGDTLLGEASVRFPAGATSVNGQIAGPEGLVLRFPLRLPSDLGGGHALSLQTPHGPVNIIIKKLRDLNFA